MTCPLIQTMMKKVVLFMLILLGLLAFIGKPTEYRYVPNESFTAGEVLTYRVHYGVINAAEATMQISNEYFSVNKRPCYKIDIYGKTTGLFDLVMRIRDNWGAYVDTASIIPHESYRYIQEGKYRKNEKVTFNHQQDKATIHKLDKETRKLKEKEDVKVPDNIVDMVGGFYFLRTLNYDGMEIGDTIHVEGFFDGKVHQVQVKIAGREMVKTPIGEVRAIVVEPSLPENDFFKGKSPITAWISDDKNRVPLKIQAELSIGALEIDIKEMKNLRN